MFGLRGLVSCVTLTYNWTGVICHHRPFLSAADIDTYQTEKDLVTWTDFIRETVKGSTGTCTQTSSHISLLKHLHSHTHAATGSLVNYALYHT